MQTHCVCDCAGTSSCSTDTDVARWHHRMQRFTSLDSFIGVLWACTQSRHGCNVIQVAPIIAGVQERGDAAVREFTSKFDSVDLEAVCVPIDDIPMPSLPAIIEASFDIAYENIYNFHKAQMESAEVSVHTMPGVTCRQVRTLLMLCPRQATRNHAVAINLRLNHVALRSTTC